MATMPRDPETRSGPGDEPGRSEKSSGGDATERTAPLPSAWRPRAGETLAGFVALRVERESEYDANGVTVLVVDSGAKPVSLWCSPTDLRSFVVESNPQPGDFVTVRFDGEEAVRGGYRRKLFCAELTRQEST